MALRTLEQEWQAFLKEVSRVHGVTPVQIENARLTFYAGAFAIIRSFSEVLNGRTSDQDADRYLRALDIEVREFNKAMAAELARRN